MNKLKYLVLPFLAIFTILFNITSVSAYDDIVAEISSDYGLYNPINNEYYVFENVNDKEYFSEVLSSKMERSYNPIKSREIFIRNISVGRKWVNYNPLTPNWSKASYYNITASYTATASGTFTYSGVNYSISASLNKGVTINTPADSNRYSRLGFDVDVQLKEYKIEMYDTSNNNKIVRTIYTKRPVILNTYNVVKYK
ncbi:TPA: hypothetical protein U1383_000241 [Streptococcus suis]|nr:hypothetical protein [Streptococcus suis]